MGLHLLAHTRFAEDGVIIDANLGPFYIGFPGIAHAGVVTAMLDEAIQLHTHRVLGLIAPTAQLNVTFKAPVPVETPLAVHGRGKVDGKKVMGSAEVRDVEGKILASAEGVLVIKEVVEAEWSPTELRKLGL